MLTVKTFARAVGISESLAYALIAARKIRHERHGLGRGKILIPEDAVAEYRKRRTVEADGGKPSTSGVFTH